MFSKNGWISTILVSVAGALSADVIRLRDGDRGRS
jgi:hypothetical protein